MMMMGRKKQQLTHIIKYGREMEKNARNEKKRREDNGFFCLEEMVSIF